MGTPEEIERAAQILVNELGWMRSKLPILVQQALDELSEALGTQHPLMAAGAPEPVERPQSTPLEACRAFQWIGQSWEHCEECDRPAWEHPGMLGQIEDDPSDVHAWRGLMAEVRASYLEGVRIEVRDGPDGGRQIVYVK